MIIESTEGIVRQQWCDVTIGVLSQGRLRSEPGLEDLQAFLVQSSWLSLRQEEHETMEAGKKAPKTVPMIKADISFPSVTSTCSSVL